MKRVAAVLCAAAATLLAQLPEKSPADLLGAQTQQRTAWANEWLHSNDPPHIAWGAWLARVDRQKALVPLLLDQVAQYVPDTPEVDRHDAMLQVLDALIQLGTVVPVDDARKLYPEFSAQSLILLVRSPQAAQPALLEIFDISSANSTWLAAGNVLLKNRTEGFAARLLDRFTQHISLHVLDPGFGSGGSGGGGGESEFSMRGPKRGWPPVGLYRLDQFAGRYPRLAATLVADGETPVYYWRVEPGNYDNPTDAPGISGSGDRDVYRAQYLNKMSEFVYPKLTLESYPKVYVVWDAVIGQHLAAAIEERVAAFHRAAETLAPAEAPSLKPHIEIVISDERQDKSMPLPILQSSQGVQVTTEFHPPLP